MAVNLSPVGGVAAQFFTNTGAVLTGGKLYTYAAGTTTPATTYTSSQGTTAWTNPIVLDAAGRVSGSGEIWLTDGINYKFVLKDSNDVLIATYDNVSGINSNFVAYTNSQEIQTATSGQTVFTLTTMQYQVGTNSLSVFVDGVNQYGPGAQYAYTETSSTSVTFVSGLHVGAQVKFTSTQQQGAGAVNASQVSFTGFKNQVGNVQDLADSDGSNWIGFDPAGTVAIARSAQEKMRDFVSVKDYGAVGDGVANDGPAINACFADPLVGAVYFPKGTYLTDVQILNNFKSARGEGWQQTTIKASTAIQSLLQLSGQNRVVEQIFFDGNNLTEYGVIMRQCNSSILQNFGIENVKVDGVYFPKANNNNTAAIRDGLIRYVGTTYSTGTASVSAGGTVVTITGAANLTTLGFRVTDDFLKVGTTQRAREITAITSNTVTVYPAFDSAETSVAYSLRKGSGIHIDTHGDNSRELLEQNTMQFCAVAGVDQTPLYGATCIRNTVEFCEFGHIIGRRSVASSTRGSEDIGPYYEGNPSGNWLVGGTDSFDIISPNSDTNLDSLVFQPNIGLGVRIRYAGYDLSEITQDQTNLTTINPTINTTQFIAGAQDCVVNLPDVPANTSSGAGQIYIWHVRLVVRTKSGFNTTIKSTTFVNGVAGATGVVVTGDYKVYDCYYQPGAGWVVQV